jgi:[ribosomal protein S18]-alanine N-acetyltransferase
MIEVAVADTFQAPALAALHGQCFPQGWSDDTFRQLLATSEVRAMVARADSAEIIGFILVRVAADECEILSLAVAPKRRCQGIGSKLIEAGAHEAFACGACAMFLEVDVNNTAATYLYRKLGFKEVGRRTGYYRICDSLADALILRCELPIGAWESAGDSSNV